MYTYHSALYHWKLQLIILQMVDISSIVCVYSCLMSLY